MSGSSLLVVVCLVLAALAPRAAAGAAGAPEKPLAVAVDGVQLASTPIELIVTVSGQQDGPSAPLEILADGRSLMRTDLAPGEHPLSINAGGLGVGSHSILVRRDGEQAETDLRLLPGWLSLLPPILAIGLALSLRNVLVALFAGVFSGVLILQHWNPFTALGRTIDSFIVPALTDADHASILIFSTLLGGMVGIVSRSGGTQGIVEWLSPYATNSRRGQLAAWAMGVLIFFDDYANTLIVGSTMRPITDRLRISREKLAYIVDSTAAPIASVIPISTWIGFEVGLIGDAFQQLALPYNAYTTFIASITYRFYPIFALVLGFAIAYTGRDAGPMLEAERRAASTGQVTADGDIPIADFSASALEPPAEAPRRAINALLPILTVIGVTIVGLAWDGSSRIERAVDESTFHRLQEAFSNANSFHVLLWASLAGVLVALGLAIGQRILTLHEATSAMVEGFKSMLMAFTVLLLAWSIGAVCDQLATPQYLVGAIRGTLSPELLPVLTFLISAAISFATGTSWATMAILVPLVIPVTHGLALSNGYVGGGPELYALLLGTISSVLAGSVWGDHCSPISDTTILSSMASGCDHMAHVRTQIPYAVAIGVVGMLVGDLPTAYGLSPWISLAVGSALIILGVRFLGRRSHDPVSR